jgi:hypothetical protein
MRIWKAFRINLMYWRFRYVTRNRLRFQNWYHRRFRSGGGSRTGFGGYGRAGYGNWRERGTAAYVYRSSGKRTWTILLVAMVIITAIRSSSISPTLAFGLSTLVLIAAAYWAMKGV